MERNTILVEVVKNAKTISEVAEVIREDWKKVYFGAVPYLEAMFTLKTKNDNFGADSARSVVSYFLSNATTYRGEVAREAKKTLNKLIK